MEDWWWFRQNQSDLNRKPRKPPYEWNHPTRNIFNSVLQKTPWQWWPRHWGDFSHLGIMKSWVSLRMGPIHDIPPELHGAFNDVFRRENFSNEPNQSWRCPTFNFHPHVPRPCLLPSSNMAVNLTASLNGQFHFNGKTIYNWRIVQRHVWLPECISFMCPVLFVKSSCGSVSRFEIPSFNVFRHFPL